MEKHYRVIWEIDEWADNPEDAARQALERMRNPESVATVFDVIDFETKQTKQIDVLELKQ